MAKYSKKLIEASVEHKNKTSLIVERREDRNILITNASASNSVHFLDENFMTVHYCMSLKKSSSMNNKIKEKIDWLLQSGIIQKNEDEKFANTKTMQEQESRPQAKVLTLNQLAVPFIFITVMLVLSCFVFFLEHVAETVSKIIVRRFLDVHGQNLQLG